MSMNIDLYACASAGEMLEELDPSHERWTKGKWRSGWIFRGQADADWRLIPSALRTDDEHAKEQIRLARGLGEQWVRDPANFLQDAYSHVEEFDSNLVTQCLVQVFAEIRNLREFFELSDSLNLSNSLPIPSDFHVFGTKFAAEYMASLADKDYMRRLWGIAPIAIAQHHGVTTRLLDWTKNPLYAAFFASENVRPSATHIAVYAIHTFYLRDKDDVRLIEVSKGHSTYIHAQEGVFTLDTQADIEYLKTGIWRATDDAPVGDVYKFTLPVNELPELARLLWLKRVTRAHMMPTLDNVIPALETKWKWQRGGKDKATDGTP